MKTNNAFLSQMLRHVLGSLFLLLIACGGGADSQQSENSEENAEKTESSSDSDEADKEEEEQSSDSDSPKSTGESIDYKTLQKYLPKSINGYEVDGEPKGSQLTVPGGSYSVAEKEFKKGDDRLMVAIADYNMADAQLNILSAAWNMQFEDDNSKAGSVKLKGGKIRGWEVFEKKDKKANLSLIVGNRFWVNISADNQKNTDFVKSLAESMDLDALMKMGK